MLSNVMLVLTTDHSGHSNEIRVSTLKHHLRRYTRRNTSDFLKFNLKKSQQRPDTACRRVYVDSILPTSLSARSA